MFIATAFCCLTLLGCSGAVRSSVRPRVTASAQYGPVPVAGRAARPTDIEAGGVGVRASQLEFGVGGLGANGAGKAKVVISYDDWNTITASSSVQPQVGLMVDPGYNSDGTVQNRFQYLADRIALLPISTFDETGIISSPEYGNYMLTAAIYNPTGNVMEFSSLGVRITAGPHQAIIADHTFYDASKGGCIVPARTLYFAYLTFKRFTPVPRTATTLSYTFSVHDLAACPGEVCAQGTPISLCQE